MSMYGLSPTKNRSQAVLSRARDLIAQRMAKKGRLDQTGGPVIDITPEDRARFRKLRKAKGMTQPQLVTRIGVSDGTISNIETGRSGQVRRAPYLAAMAFLQGNVDVEGLSRDARIKRMLDNVLKLDDRGLAAVEALIDSQLLSLNKSQ